MRGDSNRATGPQATAAAAGRLPARRWPAATRPGRCAVCDAPGACRSRGLVLCRDCRVAARPHHPADPYDDLGGSG